MIRRGRVKIQEFSIQPPPESEEGKTQFPKKEKGEKNMKGGERF